MLRSMGCHWKAIKLRLFVSIICNLLFKFVSFLTTTSRFFSLKLCLLLLWSAALTENVKSVLKINHHSMTVLSDCVQALTVLNAEFDVYSTTVRLLLLVRWLTSFNDCLWWLCLMTAVFNDCAWLRDGYAISRANCSSRVPVHILQTV
jgi:hypothetical protein